MTPLKATTRIDAVWAALSTVTVLSWWLGHHTHGDAPAAPSAAVTFAVLALAFVKVRMILQHFMEVATAPSWLRRTTDSWLVALWAAVLAVYLA